MGRGRRISRWTTSPQRKRGVAAVFDAHIQEEDSSPRRLKVDGRCGGERLKVDKNVPTDMHVQIEEASYVCPSEVADGRNKLFAIPPPTETASYACLSDGGGQRWT